MTADTVGPARCPRCGAAVRDGDPWCTLCYADLRPPAPAAPPVPPAPSEAEPGAADPLTSPYPLVEAGPVPSPEPLDPELDVPTWPCAACGTANRLERDTCAGCGAPFLSGLRDTEAPLLELPLVGDLTRLDRSHRLALAAGVVLAFLVLTLLLGVLFH